MGRIHKYSFLYLLFIWIVSMSETSAQTSEPEASEKTETLAEEAAIQAEEVKPFTGEERVERIAGHMFEAAIGYGGISGYPESIWQKGTPWEGVAWAVDYEYIPKEPVYFEIFRLPCTVSVGGIYRGYRSGGKDAAISNSMPWQANMGLMVNYIGPEAGLKLLSRSDHWSFNLKYSMGLMLTSFTGNVNLYGTDDSLISFSTVKAGYAFSVVWNVQYNFNRHWSIAANIGMCSGAVSKYLYNSDFPVYRDLPSYRWLDMAVCTIGIQYHL